MITTTGSARIYADSTGKPILVGDTIRFRGKNYTLEGFGPTLTGSVFGKEDSLNVATLIFKEPLHTDEVPHECNVDRVD